MDEEVLAVPVDPVEVQACKRLWASVFRVGVEDAINDLHKGRYWLTNDDHRPGSFSWLCELFGHNPNYIQNIIESKYK